MINQLIHQLIGNLFLGNGMHPNYGYCSCVLNSTSVLFMLGQTQFIRDDRITFFDFNENKWVSFPKISVATNSDYASYFDCASTIVIDKKYSRYFKVY